MPRRRMLSDEDRRLWDQVARNVTPLQQPCRKESDLASGTAMPGLDPTADTSENSLRPQNFRIGQAARSAPTGPDLAPPLSDRLDSFGPRPDRRAATRERRGKLRPEARIDLHGMTQAQAHPALNRFLLSSQAAGRRLVLVITGKGKDRDDGGPLPVPVGVLRHQVPHWMSLPPLRSIVLRVAPAHIRHGGDGALYVFLRRDR